MEEVGGSANSGWVRRGVGCPLAKRFTDTGKWKKQWFRELPPKMKVAWEYLRDNCDHAGIWDTDFQDLSFKVGELVTPLECETYFTDVRFVKISDDKYFLPGFVVFQYGDTLRIRNKAHLSVLKILERNEVTPLVRGPWSIDRSRSGESVEPERIVGDPAKVLAITRGILKSMESR